MVISILASNSVEECLPVKQIVVGSIPTSPAKNGIVVQWLERSPVTGEVVGSSPIGSAIYSLVAAICFKNVESSKL